VLVEDEGEREVRTEAIRPRATDGISADFEVDLLCVCTNRLRGESTRSCGSDNCVEEEPATKVTRGDVGPENNRPRLPVSNVNGYSASPTASLSTVILDCDWDEVRDPAEDLKGEAGHVRTEDSLLNNP